MKAGQLGQLASVQEVVGESPLRSKLPFVKMGGKPGRFWLAGLLNALVGEAVASGPIETLRARPALWIVHTFFVRAPNNPLSHHSGARCVRLEEGQNLFANLEILAYVYVALGKPALEKIWVATFPKEHTHYDLGSQFIVGSVEGNRGDGIASKSRPESPVRPRTDGGLPLAKWLPSFHPRNIRLITPTCPKRRMTVHLRSHRPSVRQFTLSPGYISWYAAAWQLSV